MSHDPNFDESEVQEVDVKRLEPDHLFSELAKRLACGIVIYSDTILYANDKLASMTGIAQHELTGRAVTELIHPEDRNIVHSLTYQEPKKRSATSVAVKMLDDRGEPFWVEFKAAPIEFRGVRATMAVVIDHRRDRFNRNPSEDHHRAHTTLMSISDGIITTDRRGRIDYMNPAAEKLTDWRFEEAIGRSLGELISLVDETDRRALNDPVELCLREGKRVSIGGRAVLISRGGDCEYSIELTATPIGGDKAAASGVVVLLHDVTELRGVARRESYQASHDALTGLYNRREFEQRLEVALESARAGRAVHALCYLDLDGFKIVNDTCGHIAGDNMLREIAGIIKDEVRDSDSVARVGGDEFGVLLVGCPLPKACQIADDICRAVRDFRFVWRDKIFDVGISIGIVEMSRESSSVLDALSAADSACYVAKQRGRSQVHVYSARDEQVARESGEIKWLQELQHAIRENRFELHSQAIVSLTGPTGPACEILLRMRDRTGQEVTPSSFMRAAERYRLMPSIDRWVVQTAFTALRSGALSLAQNRSCTINLSGQTLGDAQFLEFVVDCLDRTGVAPEKICFEITETSVVTNLEHAQRFIDVLHGMGCQFALDDFGSGLSSFANLKNLAINYLKIDGSFIRTLPSDMINRSMVATMIELARTLGIRVVAEQVEDQHILSEVRQLGVDYVQGFGIERPRPLRAVH